MCIYWQAPFWRTLVPEISSSMVRIESFQIGVIQWFGNSDYNQNVDSRLRLYGLYSHCEI